jgi:hypothetical protein
MHVRPWELEHTCIDSKHARRKIDSTSNSKHNCGPSRRLMIHDQDLHQHRAVERLHRQDLHCIKPDYIDPNINVKLYDYIKL